MSKTVPRAISSLIDTSHPVINTLGHTFGGRLPGKRGLIKGIKGARPNAPLRHGAPRIDVVDGKLCDDILKYLAPTLEPYKGCTIIDAHPGACVWSQKLNDFLKPKQHLLMEPDERYVTPFIQPLLDQPKSTFIHSSQAAATENGILDAFKNALAETSVLSPQAQTSDDDPRLLELDTSVLVTGNLARTFSWPMVKLQKPVPQSLVSMLQLAKWAALSHKTFNSQGLVRMLWWVADEHKAQMIPRMAHQVSGANVGMQLGAQLTEVVGVEPGQIYTLGNHTRSKAYNYFDRMPSYDAEISRLVRRKMYEAGMTIPTGRSILGRDRSPSELESAPAEHGDPQQSQELEEMRRHYEELKAKYEELKFMKESERPDHAGRSPVEIRYSNTRSLQTELGKLTTRTKEVLAALAEVGQPKIPSKSNDAIGSWLEDIEYPQSIALANDYYRQHPIATPPKTKAGKERREARTKGGGMTAVQGRVALLLDLELRLINLEVHYKYLEDRGAKVTHHKTAILQLGTDLHEHPMANRVPIPDFINRVIADEIAFFSNPRLLAFDRRPYEPLHTPVSSFWPRLPLALIDVVPTGRDLSVPGIADRYEATRTASELLKYLFVQKNHPLASVLDKIAPNAAQDLIPQVPALTDPRKGGRLDPGRLLVKMLNEDMVDGLVRAWFEWPFKPRLIELALGSEMSSSGAEVEEVGEGELIEE